MPRVATVRSRCVLQRCCCFLPEHHFERHAGADDALGEAGETLPAAARCLVEFAHPSVARDAVAPRTRRHRPRLRSGIGGHGVDVAWIGLCDPVRDGSKAQRIGERSFRGAPGHLPRRRLRDDGARPARRADRVDQLVHCRPPPLGVWSLSFALLADCGTHPKSPIPDGRLGLRRMCAHLEPDLLDRLVHPVAFVVRRLDPIELGVEFVQHLCPLRALRAPVRRCASRVLHRGALRPAVLSGRAIDSEVAVAARVIALRRADGRSVPRSGSRTGTCATASRPGPILVARSGRCLRGRA